MGPLHLSGAGDGGSLHPPLIRPCYNHSVYEFNFLYWLVQIEVVVVQMHTKYGLNDGYTFYFSNLNG